MALVSLFAADLNIPLVVACNRRDKERSNKKGRGEIEAFK
jgi:hypothetical protein